MNWFESLIYGLICGISEFLPISSSAHREILLKLFGQSASDPAQDLLVHIALLFSVFSAGRGLIDQLRRQQQMQVRNRRVSAEIGNSLELRFLKNTVVPFIITYLVLKYGIGIKINLAWLAVFSLVNGILLFSQGRMMHGNKDERFMSVLGSILVGIAGAFSAFPGISRIGITLTVFAVLGVGLQKASNWALLLSIPALILTAGIDVLNIISGFGNVNFPENIFGYILSAVGSYIAGYLGVLLLKTLSSQRDHAGFAYYSWGVALFAFIIYLTVV